MYSQLNNLAAQISASESQNNDFGRAVSLCLLIRNYRFLVVMSQTIFFFNSKVTVHIKPTAPYHTTVLTALVKKIQLPLLLHTLFLGLFNLRKLLNLVIKLLFVLHGFSTITSSIKILLFDLPGFNPGFKIVLKLLKLRPEVVFRFGFQVFQIRFGTDYSSLK